jgi:hypothetical protein
MNKADAVLLIMDRAEQTGIKFQNTGESMDALSVLRSVWKENPGRVDALDSAFGKDEISPEEYWKRTTEVIEMCERVWFVLEVEKKALLIRERLQGTETSQSNPAEAHTEH